MSRGGRHSEFPKSLSAIFEDWQSRRQGLLAALTEGAAPPAARAWLAPGADAARRRGGGVLQAVQPGPRQPVPVRCAPAPRRCSAGDGIGCSPPGVGCRRAHGRVDGGPACRGGAVRAARAVSGHQLCQVLLCQPPAGWAAPRTCRAGARPGERRAQGRHGPEGLAAPRGRAFGRLAPERGLLLWRQAQAGRAVGAASLPSCRCRAQQGATPPSACRLQLFREMNDHHTLFEIVTDKYTHTQMTSHRPSAVCPSPPNPTCGRPRLCWRHDRRPACRGRHRRASGGWALRPPRPSRPRPLCPPGACSRTRRCPQTCEAGRQRCAQRRLALPPIELHHAVQLTSKCVQLYWPDDALWYLVEIQSVNMKTRVAKCALACAVLGGSCSA